MRVKVKKWGNSAAVRIPASVMQAANVALDQPVEVREEAGRVVIIPVRPRPRYKLEELLAQCKPQKRRSREDRAWLEDPPVGRELI